MRSFVATLVYELHPSTDPDARKLLRAHLVGRRWQDKMNGAALPANCVWIRRSAADDQTVDDVHAACGQDLQDALAAVVQSGRPIALVRAWVQVSGSGAFGPTPAPAPPGAP